MSKQTDNGDAALANLSAASFDTTVSRAGIVLIDCWASWCKACKDFQPVFEAAAERHRDHTFAKLDTQQEQALVESLGIEHIPALILYRDGLLLFQQPGYFDSDGLDDIIDQAESLDMNEVRKAVEESPAGAELDR